MNRMKTAVAIFLSFNLWSTSLMAWGPEGHRLVGDIAREHLTPTARLHVKDLLGNDDLATISVWADDIKGERPETFGWHFVDIPKEASGFSEPRDCYRPEERHPSTLEDHHNCVVDRIIIFKRRLTDRNAPRQERVEALKFLVHFVGDVHQPLHAIGEARGGNDIHVVEFGSLECGKRPCNLHFAWDLGLIEHTGLSERQYVSRLNQLIVSHRFTSQPDETPEEWANESFVFAKKAWLNNGDAVDDNYYKDEIGVVDRQLALAGLRLALLINEALGR